MCHRSAITINSSSGWSAVSFFSISTLMSYCPSVYAHTTSTHSCSPRINSNDDFIPWTRYAWDVNKNFLLPIRWHLHSYRDVCIHLVSKQIITLILHSCKPIFFILWIHHNTTQFILCIFYQNIRFSKTHLHTSWFAIFICYNIHINLLFISWRYVYYGTTQYIY